MTDEPIDTPVNTDPIIKFFSNVQFQTDVFEVLRKATTNPEEYDKYFQSPELFVLMNAAWVLETTDPNKGNEDHAAIINMLKWITVKCASDPVWYCYFGWLFRFVAIHTDPSSYWPVKYSPRFLPKNFIKRGDPVKIAEENRKIKTPEEVFKKSK